MYTIKYYDHRGDAQTVTCSAFEDAERIAAFIAELHNVEVVLNDGHYDRLFGTLRVGQVVRYINAVPRIGEWWIGRCYGNDVYRIDSVTEFCDMVHRSQLIVDAK